MILYWRNLAGDGDGTRRDNYSEDEAGTIQAASGSMASDDLVVAQLSWTVSGSLECTSIAFQGSATANVSGTITADTVTVLGGTATGWAGTLNLSTRFELSRTFGSTSNRCQMVLGNATLHASFSLPILNAHLVLTDHLVISTAANLQIDGNITGGQTIQKIGANLLTIIVGNAGRNCSIDSISIDAGILYIRDGAWPAWAIQGISAPTCRLILNGHNTTLRLGCANNGSIEWGNPIEVSPGVVGAALLLNGDGNTAQHTIAAPLTLGSDLRVTRGPRASQTIWFRGPLGVSWDAVAPHPQAGQLTGDGRLIIERPTSLLGKVDFFAVAQSGATVAHTGGTTILSEESNYSASAGWIDMVAAGDYPFGSGPIDVIGNAAFRFGGGATQTFSCPTDIRLSGVMSDPLTGPTLDLGRSLSSNPVVDITGELTVQCPAWRVTTGSGGNNQQHRIFGLGLSQDSTLRFNGGNGQSLLLMGPVGGTANLLVVEAPVVNCPLLIGTSIPCDLRAQQGSIRFNGPHTVERKLINVGADLDLGGFTIPCASYEQKIGSGVLRNGGLSAEQRIEISAGSLEDPAGETFTCRSWLCAIDAIGSSPWFVDSELRAEHTAGTLTFCEALSVAGELYPTAFNGGNNVNWGPPGAAASYDVLDRSVIVNFEDGDVTRSLEPGEEAIDGGGVGIPTVSRHPVDPAITDIRAPGHFWLNLNSGVLWYRGATDWIRARDGVASGIPAPWFAQDIGEPYVAGRTTHNGGRSWTLTGSGDFPWDPVDDFHYVYQLVTGDFILTVRIDSIMSSDPLAEMDYAALAVRESLEPGSRTVMVGCTNHLSGSIFDSYRSVRGDDHEAVYGVAGAMGSPVWLRIQRRGSLFVQEQSLTGVVWSPISAITLDLEPSLYVGVVAGASELTSPSTVELSQLHVVSGLPDWKTLAGQIPEFQDDFVNGVVAGQWSRSNSGSGSGFTAIAPPAGYTPGLPILGVVQVRSSSSTGRAGAYLAAQLLRFDQGVCTVWCRFALAQVATTAEDFSVRIGFLDSNTNAEPYDGVYLEYTRAAGFVAITENNRSKTTAAIAVTPEANHWYDLRITVYAPGYNGGSALPRADFFLDDVNVTTNYANIPTTAGRETSAGFVIWRVAGSSAKDLLLDYVRLKREA